MSKINFSAILLAVFLLSVGKISNGQSTQSQAEVIETFDVLADQLGELRHNISSCAKNSHDFTTSLREINRHLGAMTSPTSLRSLTLAPGNQEGNCNCSRLHGNDYQGNSCSAEMTSLLTEVRQDLSIMRSKLEQSQTGQSSVTSYLASGNMSVAGECYVDLRSSGCHDGSFKGSHIRVNWTNVHYSDANGIALAIVDPVACLGTPFPLVNPSGVGATAAQHLVAYLNLLTVGQIVVGSTHHDAFGNLGAASAALGDIGVKTLSRLNSCGKFAFIAQKGFPQKTVAAVKQAGEGNLWLVVKLHLGNSPNDVSFILLNNP